LRIEVYFQQVRDAVEACPVVQTFTIAHIPITNTKAVRTRSSSPSLPTWPKSSTKSKLWSNCLYDENVVLPAPLRP
jgi:hypothetical protein